MFSSLSVCKLEYVSASHHVRRSHDLHALLALERYKMYSVGIFASRMWFIQCFMKTRQLIQKLLGITWQNGDVFSLYFLT